MTGSPTPRRGVWGYVVGLIGAGAIAAATAGAVANDDARTTQVDRSTISIPSWEERTSGGVDPRPRPHAPAPA